MNRNRGRLPHLEEESDVEDEKENLQPHIIRSDDDNDEDDGASLGSGGEGPLGFVGCEGHWGL